MSLFRFQPLMLGAVNLSLLIILIFMFGACGYKFPGGGSLPGNVKNVFVSILENRTNETGLESIITNDLIYEFTTKKRAGNRDDADAVLSGIIGSVRTETISRKGQHLSTERRVTVAVNLKLTHKDGQVVWSAQGLSVNEAYAVESDKQQTNQNRHQAILVLSRRLAEDVYSRLTDDF